jgi:hypothetical protein
MREERERERERLTDRQTEEQMDGWKEAAEF